MVSESERLRTAAELGDAKAVAATVHQVVEMCSSCHDKYVTK